MDMIDFKKIKESLKKTGGSPSETADRTGWSVRTVQRVKKAKSLKQYGDLCF